MESALLSRDGLDMNEPANLALWTQIIVLISSSEEVETLFQDPNPQQQRAIQDWAHSVAYDYEYTLATRTARVVKPCETVPVTAAETNATDLFDFDSYPMPEEGEIDLGGTNEDPRIPDVSLSDDITQWFDRQDQSFWSTHYQAPLETEDDCVGHSRPKDMTELPIVRQVAPSTPQESISDPIQGKQNKNARPLSPSNSHIGRARKMLGRLNGRRQSVHSQASSGYQEVVFDSGSSRPSTPGTPGRRGPLDAAARAAIKAVKAVKACWRCKFLRKPCSEDNPCLRCPTKSANCKEKSWPAVGCNRGSFKEVLPPLQLCPSSDATQDRTFHDTTLPYCMQVKLNEEYQSQLSARAEVLQEALVVSTEREPTTLISYIRSLEKTDVDYNFEEFIQFSSSLPMAPSMRVAFTPLEECIAAVVYEATCCNTSILMRVDGSPQALSRIVKMLYSAARHQANIDSDELVAQSIICLRSSFEAARITRNPLWLNAHKLCKTDICQVDSIKTLNEHLGLYLDALSKVFFKKENMKNKETWWLSTFYSFAIQGIVRELIRELSPTPESQAATDRYLHLALRLFIASSGNYDPLMRDYTSSGKGKETSLSYISDLEEAKTAMEQSSWASKRISSSADYLRKLFEDDGRHEMTENDPASISSFPSELLPSDDEPGEDDGGRWDEEASLEEKKTSRARRRILTPRSPLHVREPKVSSANELSMLDQRSPPPWSSSIRAYSGSRPYRPSSLSSMESASDLGAIPTSLLPEHIKIPQMYSSQMSSYAPSVRSDNSDRSNSPIDLYIPTHQDLQDCDDYPYGNGKDLSGLVRDHPEVLELPWSTIPKNNRTITDILADGLYNPSFLINPVPSTSARPDEDSRSFDIVTQKLPAADGQSPPTIPSRERSPFRQGSPIPLGNDFSSYARFGTASHLREQQKAENDARALQAQLERTSPKEDDFVYHESEDYADVPLFPQQHPSGPQSLRQPSDLFSGNDEST